LKELLSSPHFTRVGEYGRRVTPLEQITSGKEKLEQKTIDFEKLEDAGLKDGRWDVVFITYVFGFQMQVFI
jgi:oxidoreductase